MPGTLAAGALAAAGSGNGAADAQQPQRAGTAAGAAAADASAAAEPDDATSRVPPDGLVSHPLRFEWVLWHDYSPPKSKSASGKWGENLKKLHAIRSVEEFWSLFNNIAPPSMLPIGSDYSLFKAGVEPKWEDRANEKGGRWQLLVPKAKRDRLDRLWVVMVLGVLGDELASAEAVTGVAVSVRPQQHRLAVWVRDCTDSNACMAIGNSLRRIFEAPPQEYIFFSDHQAAARGPKAAHRYTA